MENIEEKASKKMKKEFFKSQKKNQNDILSGFIITCDNHREKNAINDAYNILNEYTEKLYPNLKLKQDPPPSKKVKTEDGKNDNKNQLVSDLLDDELNQLNEKDERLYYTYDIGIKKGVVFIKINPKFTTEVSPYVLCDEIMKDVHEKKHEISRFCHKLIPIEKAFSANFEVFKIFMKEILQKTFKDEEKISWFLEFKSRNNSKYKQKEFLDYILENIGKNHFVSYKEPQITLFVEINQGTMCLAALQNFFEYKKYSIHAKNSLVESKNPKKEKKTEEKTEKIEEIKKNNENKSEVDEEEVRLL